MAACVITEYTRETVKLGDATFVVDASSTKTIRVLKDKVPPLTAKSANMVLLGNAKSQQQRLLCLVEWLSILGYGPGTLSLEMLGASGQAVAWASTPPLTVAAAFLLAICFKHDIEQR